MRYASQTHPLGLRPVPLAATPTASSMTCRFAYTVRDTQSGACLVATRDIARGARILLIDGRLQRHPTRYSIQLDIDVHIECDSELESSEMRARHPWRFLNHACNPNARVHGRILFARRAIGAGDEITFDYTTTEISMAEPFHCGCGAAKCLGVVRGFVHLDAAQRRARAARIAPHLQSVIGSA